MKLINKFVYDEKQYFTDLAKKEGIADIDEFLNELNITNDVYKFEYYKDNKGNLFKFNYFNGNKINWDDVNGYVRGHVYKFENKTNVLFQ